MTGSGSELVDYEAAAARYHAGRAIPAEGLARWGTAVRSHLPVPDPGRPHGGRLRVLDLGAGTGIFAAAWPDWGATHVVAVEVAAGMIAARQAAAPYVRARAEGLPLAAGSVDLCGPRPRSTTSATRRPRSPRSIGCSRPVAG